MACRVSWVSSVTRGVSPAPVFVEPHRSGRTLLVLTPAALKSHYVREEWTTALNEERLVPVRVVDLDPGGLLGARSYVDLVGLDEDAAPEAHLEFLWMLGYFRGWT